MERWHSLCIHSDCLFPQQCWLLGSPSDSFPSITMDFASPVLLVVFQFLVILTADFRVDYNRTAAQLWSTGSANKDDLLYPLLLATMIIYIDVRDVNLGGYAN